jgi:hypothetical protein
MGIRDLLFVGLILGGAAAVGASLYPPRIGPRDEPRPARSPVDPDLRATVARVDEAFRKQWAEEGLTPATRAPDLAVFRRLAVALTGSIPSLEEHRLLESMPERERSARYVEMLLSDRRFGDYFAERLARAYVGTEGGPFLVYRRRRFVSWLSDQIMGNQPYDAIVRALIASDGLWTDRPATNFLTVTYDPDKKVIDAERLAGRVARSFLAARIDCAQCHDHPFAAWKQRDFQGLAAFFGQAESGLTGIHDEAKAAYRPTDRKTGKPHEVEPHVPFLSEFLPPGGHGNRRERLARWVTDAKNPSLSRATVNRVWALMFGRPLVEPVDDVVTLESLPTPLTILADDFIHHGFDLRRLVRAIAATEVFHLDSATDSIASTEGIDPAEKAWALFPLTRLRPEQVVGSLLQAATLSTIDGESPIIVRLAKSIGQSAFINRFGDSGEDEFDARGGTIPQRLLMMNGDLVRDKTKPDLFNAASRVGYFAPTDRRAVEIAYLAVLTRKPTAEESRHFEAKLAGTRGDERGARMSDLYWTLVNSTEFSWNH